MVSTRSTSRGGRLRAYPSADSTTEHGKVGQRYIHHASRGSTAHLFLRASTASDGALGRLPFFYAGPASYVEHFGSRPMRIIWRLANALPADVFHLARVAA